MPKLTEGMLRMKRDNDAPIAIPPRAGRGRRARGRLAPTRHTSRGPSHVADQLHVADQHFL